MPERAKGDRTEQERASRLLTAREQNRRDLARMRGIRQARDREKAGDLEHFAETVEGLPEELQQRMAEAKAKRESPPEGAGEEAGDA